jgi:uncharacterized protein
VTPDATGATTPPDGPTDRSDGRVLPIVPDSRQRLPGRGAWLHRDRRCAELAQRRRAYARALRVPGPVDPTPVLEYLTAADGSTASTTSTTTTSQITSAKPQES